MAGSSLISIHTAILELMMVAHIITTITLIITTIARTIFMPRRSQPKYMTDHGRVEKSPNPRSLLVLGINTSTCSDLISQSIAMAIQTPQ